MSKRKFQANITYSITTEESVLDGDFAEHGWWLPGGYEIPLEDSEGYHEDAYNAAENGEYDLDLGSAIYYAKELDAIHEISFGNDSISACSVDAPCDRDYIEQGEERRYYLHISGCSQGTLKRIERLLKGE